ncbi:MAG: hypothetical protein ACK526_15655 [Planctomyces sp.]
MLVCLITLLAPNESQAVSESGAAGNQATDVSEQTKKPGPSSTDQNDIKALHPFSVLVGKWRAVGQPQRGSSTGSWSEEISGAWDFSEDSARLVIVSTEHRQFRRLILSADPISMTPVAVLELNPKTVLNPKTEPNKKTEPGDKSSLEPEMVPMAIDPMTIGKETVVFQSSDGQLPIRRCTIRRISEIRMSILLEQRNTNTGTFRRVSELGMTRAGERLAKGNSGERQCIVTGGLGTISVSHNGMTFYVCCEGCQQAFQDDPDGIIAAWRERLRTEK